MEIRHMAETDAEVKVWDPLVRFGHWTLVAAFAIAYVTAEDFEDLHIAAGYWVGAYVIVRVVWGVVGPQHARFADFVYGPGKVFAYLAGLVRGRAPRYLGHSPAGGAMIVALLLCLSVTVITGLAVEADSEGEGPLAALLGQPLPAAADRRTPVAPAGAARVESRESEAGDGEKDSAYEELHETFANLTLVLIALHVLGVFASSLAHRENLVRSMITGRKPALRGNEDRSGQH